MRKLARERDDAIVLLGARDAKATEPYGGQERVGAVEQGEATGVIGFGRNEDHGRATEKVGARMREAGVLRACHGVRAHEREAVHASKLESACADGLLHASSIDNDRAA